MKLLMAGVLCLCMISCVGTKKITILTQPDGAEISINGTPQGKTPLVLEVKQTKALGIVASKPGHEVTAYTVPTRTNWWLSLLWTKNDPRAQYIEQDEVMITLKKIPSAANFRASEMPAYTGGGGYTTPKPAAPPVLRPMPADLMP